MTSVKLVSITPDIEKLIAYCARVSSKNQSNEKVTKLISYLIKNKHWSPFEMGNMVVEIETTRAIAPQILRHRSFSFQELSLRYANPDELEKPLPGLMEMAYNHEWRLQDSKNRQNSIEPDEDKQVELASFTHEFTELCKYAEDLYDRLLQAGVAKESARFVLPMIQPTRLYMNGTIRSWIHYCQLRADKATQKEHREIAEQILAIMKAELPIVYEAAFGGLSKGYYQAI